MRARPLTQIPGGRARTLGAARAAADHPPSSPFPSTQPSSNGAAMGYGGSNSAQGGEHGARAADGGGKKKKQTNKNTGLRACAPTALSSSPLSSAARDAKWAPLTRYQILDPATPPFTGTINCWTADNVVVDATLGDAEPACLVPGVAVETRFTLPAGHTVYQIVATKAKGADAFAGLVFKHAGANMSAPGEFVCGSPAGKGKPLFAQGMELVDFVAGERESGERKGGRGGWWVPPSTPSSALLCLFRRQLHDRRDQGQGLQREAGDPGAAALDLPVRRG